MYTEKYVGFDEVIRLIRTCSKFKHKTTLEYHSIYRIWESTLNILVRKWPCSTPFNTSHFLFFAKNDVAFSCQAHDKFYCFLYWLSIAFIFEVTSLLYTTIVKFKL